MDFVEQEDRLRDSGFSAEQARGLLSVIQSGDAQAMTRADAAKMESILRADLTTLRSDMERMETSLRREMDVRFEAVDSRFDALDMKFDGKFELLNAKLDRISSRTLSSVWTIGIAVLGLFVAMGIMPRL